MARLHKHLAEVDCRPPSFQPAEWTAMTFSTASSKVGMVRLRPVTSSPRWRARRLRTHFWRASARLTWGQVPSPRLRGRAAALRAALEPCKSLIL